MLSSRSNEFTLAWFKSTWKTMNLMMAIMPTTLLGVLPVGLLLVQNGSISPRRACNGDYPFPQHCWTVDESNHFH